MTDSTLFERSTDRVPFVFAEIEARLTNDILVQLATAQSSEERELIELRDRLVNGTERLIYQGDDWTESAVEDLDTWRITDAKNSTLAITEGVGLMLVFAFLERTLRSIAEDLTSEAELSAFLKGKRARSKVDAHLNYLRGRCGLQFSLPPSFVSLQKKERAVRDSFTHGDWDYQYFAAKQGMAKKALYELTPILKEFERAVAAITS